MFNRVKFCGEAPRRIAYTKKGGFAHFDEPK